MESYHQQVNLTAPTITFPGIKKYKMFSIISELVYGIIYKNNKKEKRVIRHQEVYKFCDATLKRVLEGLKSYKNDVKYGYVTHNLSKEDVEYLQMFAEEIEERLKYPNQMRRWEIARDSPVITTLHDDPYMLVRQAYTPIAMDTKSKPLEDPIETEETQPPFCRAAPFSPNYILASLDYTLDTPHSNEDSEPIAAAQTRTASPSDSISPLSPDHLLTHISPTSTPS
ncbi:hypothetical protein Tco_1182269 [Tanacetum coccineum]